MARYLFVGAICFFAALPIMAADPAPNAPDVAAPNVPGAPAPSAPAAQLTAISGRKRVEALLQAPAGLDFGKRKTITVGDLLAGLHKQQHLSIRYDIPALSALYGFEAGDLESKGAVENKSPQPISARAKYPTTGGRLVGNRSPVAYPVAPSVAVAQYLLVPSGPAGSGPSPLLTLAPLPPTVPPGVAAPPLAAPGTPVAKANPAVKADVPQPIAPPAASPAAPLPCPEAQQPGNPAKESETAQDFIKEAGQIQISVATIDGQTMTVGTALRLALDAVPVSNAEDSAGMPLPLTNATQLDFLVENDGILITTRLKALTYKETRVYSIKNLKDIDPQELSTVICQSIRPWSWRSRIDELGEQLKAGTSSVSSATIASLVKSGIQLASAETGIDVAMPTDVIKVGDAKSETAKPESDKPAAIPADAKSDGATELQEAAAIGNAVVNTLVTAVHASLTTVEVMHYADPPTGSIRVLPGKLIITQSQAGHREIAELLKQLGEE